MFLNSPFPLLLSSNISPTEDQSLVVRSVIRDTERDLLNQLRNHNNLPVSQKKSSEHKIKAYYGFLQSHRPILSRLRSFPPELLSEIFRHVAMERDIDAHLHDFHPPIEQPYTVSHVSRYWREVAISTPRIWTNIPHIVLWAGSTRQPSPGFMQMFRIHLERSQDAPLHITFSFLQTASSQILDHLISTCERWASLSLRVGRFDSLEYLSSRLKDRLTSLTSFRTHLEKYYSLPSRLEMLVGAVSLTRIVVLPSDPWSRSFDFPLKLNDSQIRRFSGHLMRDHGGFTLCQDLNLYGPLNEVESIDGAMNCVKSLRLHHRKAYLQSLPILSILDGRIFPHLKHLFMMGCAAFWKASLVDLRTHSLSSIEPFQRLTTLCLHIPDMTPSSFEGLLPFTPNISSLDIIEASTRCLHVLYLSTVNGVPIYVPLLTSLTIRYPPRNSHARLAPILYAIALLRTSFQIRHRTKGEAPLSPPSPSIMKLPPFQLRCFFRTYSECYTVLTRAEDLEEPRSRGEMQPSSVLELKRAINWRVRLRKGFFGSQRKGQSVNAALQLCQFRAIQNQDMYRLNKTFSAVEKHTFQDPLNLEESRIHVLMQDISATAEGLIPQDDVYTFRMRAGALVHQWKPLLREGAKDRKWAIDDDAGVKLLFPAPC